MDFLIPLAMDGENRDPNRLGSVAMIKIERMIKTLKIMISIDISYNHEFLDTFHRFWRLHVTMLDLSHQDLLSCCSQLSSYAL